ncbi:CDP-alcohol phosphatidyltransferase family protein [Empedobacter tilapiae]|uniref:CDP-alcohol phosphatidyltransferase family protein n=1 Tax=Empedobacter tilapiae TaxID=2491114 RepID=UPI0028D195E8|nr:CDP-alcohol phosphatidyltransferase family protein [Empedobacter tilapiae]
MKNHIPKILIFSRLIIGFIILLLCFYQRNNYKEIIVLLLTVGLLTDIFDGMIARKLNISTQILRRLDSTIDQIFFICVIISSYIICPKFYEENLILLSILIGTELLTYSVSFIKFKKEIATHSIGAKFWTLILFATLIQIILNCESKTLFLICFWVGIITRIEIVLIILTLKKWTNDVPSLFHAIKLRRGLPIKRNKLFNG